MAGHGTFIAGVVRQHSPDATLVIAPVMYGDGAADEADVIETLEKLIIWNLLRQQGRVDGAPLDVVCLSFGYYHETPGSVSDEAGLFAALRKLRCDGVCVIAAAGNGATTLEFWPAALAPRPVMDETGTSVHAAPLVSVGATNPCDPAHLEHATVAPFSNSGSWVHAYRCGVGVVSTMPTGLNGSLRPALHVDARPGMPAAQHSRPGRLLLWFRGLERQLVLRPRLRRPARHGTGRDRARGEVRSAHRAGVQGRRRPAVRTTGGDLVMHTDAGADSLAMRAANAFRAYRAGQSAAMSTLVDEVTPLLWHVARQQGLSHQAAEDVVQNTWLKLVEHAPSIADPQSVLKWLITTTKRDSWAVVAAPPARRAVGLRRRAGAGARRHGTLTRGLAARRRRRQAWCGSTSRRFPNGAGRCFASSPSPTSRTTRPSPRRSGCRSAASARRAAAASPSSAKP